MQIYDFALYFFTYGFLGWCTEVAFAAVKQKGFVNRGFLNGPICPIYGIGVGLVVQFLMPVKENLLLLYMASTLLVTLIEGITGYLMDRIFHHKWWDYSDQPFNLGGYVCLVFSLIWGVACVLIVRVVHPVLHHVLALIPITLGSIILAILGIALMADCFVTASEILKLNKKLEALEKIAGELKELSDKFGENIYEGVMETREKLEESAQDQRNRIEALKKKYQEVAEYRMKVSNRLMKAFPKMESRKHKEILEQLKEKVRRRKM